MACCILTAVIMNQIIKLCDAFDLRFLEIKYNDDEEDACDTASATKNEYSGLCHITVSGMTCSACSLAIVQELEAVHGVLRADVSMALTRATVSYDPSAINPTDLIGAVQKVGYDATLEQLDALGTAKRLGYTQELQDLRQAISSAGVCSTIIASVEYVLSLKQFGGAAPYFPVSWLWVVLFLASKVQIYDAWPIHMRAWCNGRRKMSMDTLLSSSLLLSFGLSVVQITFLREQSGIAYASSGSFLTIVILAGKYLQAVLKRESHRDLAMLYELQAQKETYQLINSEVSIPASLLRKGDEILIRPQANIPCDCFILEGSSTINESTITGEVLPVTKSVGDFLFAGTKALSNQIHVSIAQIQTESSLAKIIEGISAATEYRMEGTKPLEAVMSHFVAMVICLAVIAFSTTLWGLQSQGHIVAIMNAFERAATVLAAACPCGIGIATPSAAMAGIDCAYSRGILLGGGLRTMQALSETTHIVMDKTGTLTQGRLEVVRHHFNEDLRLNRQLCYRLLAAAELGEARVHPVAKAVFKWALAQALSTTIEQTVASTRNLQRSLGLGVTCEVRGHSDEWIPVHIGSASFFSSRNIPIPLSRVDQVLDATMVHFAFYHTHAGYILLHDTVRPSAPSVVSTLMNSGKEVTMLTGDTAAEATRISSSLGIRVLGSRTLPEDKVSHVQALQKQGHRVAMVGDGINDAPAQVAADVGISVSLAQGCLAGAGSVVILSNDLNALLALFEISKKVVRQAWFNVAWALIYNAFAMSLAVGVWEHWGWSVGPKEAGMMMAGSSVSVLCMSLWLRWTLRNDATRKN